MGDHFVNLSYRRTKHILLKLKNDHNLKTIPKATLFQIFSENNTLLLFLLENDLIELASIVKKIELDCDFEVNTSSLETRLLFWFFMLEIKKNDLNFYNKYTSHFPLDDSVLQYINTPENIEIFNKKREEGVNDSYLATIIREDRVDEFVQYMSPTWDKFYSNINFSIFECNKHLKEITTELYIMSVGAVNIFKFCYLNNFEYDQETLYHGVLSGNLEIFHLIEENVDKLYPHDVPIMYHQNNLYRYFQDQNPLPIAYDYETTIEHINFEIFLEIFQQEIIEISDDINSLFLPLAFSNIIPFAKFLLSQENQGILKFAKKYAMEKSKVFPLVNDPPFLKMAKNGYFDIIKLYLAKLDNNNFCKDDLYSFLYYATLYNNLDIVTILLRSNRINPNKLYLSSLTH
ncbi:hypothetical protein TRFO_40280 [Tritrichomonas foetus]|uniref:DUF3447 domain-containing protein n=1 Tax=Tritrichomonas foetus TaxID=1144522 RepID=A0A1J4J889_9EUKA|nr:hypothetical protein TRFO_40280 [Tritrichomonas foetus]|eukprot:OHS93444.1 hypothetical protein TRFO_40280 [Tritrichomonas foetus]